MFSPRDCQDLLEEAHRPHQARRREGRGARCSSCRAAVANRGDERFAEVVALNEAARGRAYQAVNAELVTHYWELGEYTSRKIASAEWGDGIVEELAADLATRTALRDEGLMEVDGEVTTSVFGDVAWARHRATLFAEKLQPPLSTNVRVADAVHKVFAGLKAAQQVQVNEASDEFSAYVDHGRTLPKSRTFTKLQGDPVPGSTHELYGWSDGATGRLFGHYDASGVFVFDRLAGHLP